MSGPLLDFFNDPPVMCGVCGRVGVFDMNTRTYQHGAQDTDDHPYVPVRITDAPEQLQGRCDFCNLTGEQHWLLPVEDYPVGLLPDGREYWNRGGYAACDACADLIRRNRWTALVNRVAELRCQEGSAKTLIELRAMYTFAYKELRRHITGPLHYDPRPEAT